MGLYDKDPTGAWPTSPVPTTTPPGPRPNPFGGTLPPGFPDQPVPGDFRFEGGGYGELGDLDSGSYLAAYDRWMGMAADQAEFNQYGVGGYQKPSGPSGPSPEQLAIERSKVHAQNMATFLDATVAELDAEIAADRLNLDQATAEFNRRMDALAEGGKQMSEMWQWTSQPGAETIHTGLREKLGMEPWKSAAIPFDPFAMAWDIVEQSPEILQTQPDFDPLQEALDLMEQFV